VGVWLPGDKPGTPARVLVRPGTPPAAPPERRPDRLFPTLAVEVAAPIPLDGEEGSIHLGAPNLERLDEPALRALLTQAGAIVALVARLGRSEEKARTLAGHLAQLEKLASVGRTAAGIVHELNNPLTTVIAYSDYLARRLRSNPVEPTDLERLERIHEAASRIQRFSRDLIDYSRPAQSLPMPVDLHQVMDRALGFCMHGLRGADITVERSYRDIPSIEGVESPLTQVFVNLFTNAWHAMAHGGGVLRIETSWMGDRVRVEVSDDGPGIDPLHLARVFDPYFTTKSPGAGVGLGLSIVRQIIGDHGGSVDAANRTPRGATFRIELPVRRG
jgi:signal transduction histidine kinase